MDNGVVGACVECGGRTYCIDYECGESTCVECGCVDSCGRLMVSTATFKETFDASGARKFAAPVQESAVVGAFLEDVDLTLALSRQKNNNSAPYRRETYFAERISQWRCQEPSINAQDFAHIQERYYDFTGRWRLASDEHNPEWIWEQNRCLSKDECRFLLWDIDNSRISIGDCPYFVKKYLEKYLTIRMHLGEGTHSLGLRVSDSFVFRMKEIFAKLQPAFAYTVRSTGVRYSFVNYNFCFRRIFDIMMHGAFGIDFPPLKSKKKREDIVVLWANLIVYLRWPYLNSDAQLFGPAHAIELPGLLARRTASAAPTAAKRTRIDASPPAAAATTHTSGSDHRFRGECDTSSCQSGAGRTHDEIMHDVCLAFGGADTCSNSGADDGNCEGFWDSGIRVLEQFIHSGTGGLSS